VKFAAVDIEAARAALSRLVEGGNAWAAVDLGSTYDPNILNALGVRSFPAEARTWYQMAQQMWSPDAVGLLESLERSERRSRYGNRGSGEVGQTKTARRVLLPEDDILS
jgi:TPR repeat protein